MEYKNKIFILRNIHKPNDKKYYLKFIIMIKKIEILIKLFII